MTYIDALGQLQAKQGRTIKREPWAADKYIFLSDNPPPEENFLYLTDAGVVTWWNPTPKETEGIDWMVVEPAPKKKGKR